MRKKHPPYCPPTEHKFAPHQETQVIGGWYGYQPRTLLFCEKCGLHFYVERTPTDYAASDLTSATVTWKPLDMTITNYNSNAAGPAPIVTFGGESRCQ